MQRISPSQFEIFPLGEAAVWVRLRDVPADQLAAAIASLMRAISARFPAAEFELVPGMQSLALHGSSPAFDAQQTAATLGKILENLRIDVDLTSRIVELPVCYDAEFAPDLADVATRCGLSVGDVVRLHASSHYTVRMLGFTPGFPYLAGLPPQLNLPRRAIPRLTVPAGSVAIAGGQAGIYPRPSPGGWHLIGRTPRILFDPQANPPNALAWGDRIQFVPISVDEFLASEP